MARERPDSTRSRPLTPAEAALVEENRRLAWWTASRMLRRASRYQTIADPEALFEDLLDASLFGLTYAAKTYNPTLARFSTYAVEVMQGECRRFLQRQRAKLPPSHLSFVSLQDPIPSESPSGDSFADVLPDPNAVDPQEAAARRALPGLLASLIARLPEADAEVIRRRYLRGENLDKVGEGIGRSRQRAHQIERRALGRLREFLMAEGYQTAADLM
ncbi:MAG: sigma-70 family RNA polymerase sigma factor [Armatimonadetes bacterium]|nr:sigma-70 family RNA polymerase sigma factor [Armatimonadota bacterium]